MYRIKFCDILDALPFFHPCSGREVERMQYLIDFFIAVGAQVVGYFLCKWLDHDNSKGE